MSLIESSTLGRTNSAVSRIGFGGAPGGLANYLDPFSPVDTEQREGVIAAIGRAVEVGINYFDTAAAYGTGESEKFSARDLLWLGSRPSATIYMSPRRSATTNRVHANRSSVR